MNKKNCLTKTVLGSLLLSGSAISSYVYADDALYTALSSGKTDFSARVRYENVDDDLAAREANATTARITLGYKTGTFHGLGLYGQVEHVQELFGDNFNHPARPQPGYATVADPEGTEINQAYVFFDGIADTSIKAGRQVLTYRDAPFHRFVGTVLWRQNWQTMDAFSVANKSLPNTTVNYSYIWNVNRIFGEDAPSPLNDFDSNSHLLNVKYAGIPKVNLEAYAYLLDFENAAAFSTNTYGLRASGAVPLDDSRAVIYAAEYAHQTDSADNPNDISADYFLGEVGMKFKFSGPVKALVLKASYELQSGEGGADRFVTILGTNHAYQGWADRFLVTPGDGVEDIYLTAILKAYGAKFVASYHDFSSDNGSYDYGSEFDLLAVKTFKKHYTAGLKYADYNADSNASNTGSTAADTSKLWAFVQVKF